MHPYLFSDAGEPNLSSHLCRLTVYLSTLAKPISLYLTALFGLERIVTKIITKFFLTANAGHRLLFQRLFALSIFIGVTIIFALKLDQTIDYIPKNDFSSSVKSKLNPNIRGVDSNSTETLLTFEYCYRSMSIVTYAKIVSFTLIQSWFDYLLFSLIIFSSIIIVAHQYYILRFHQNSYSIWSINTKFFLSLSSCVILFEVILLLLHSIVANEDNRNTDTQVNFLQAMLMVYNIRSIYLPLIIFITQCHRLRELINEFFFVRPYLDQIDETDRSSNGVTAEARSSFIS